MTAVEFCYWLQGYVELTPLKVLDQRQLDIIKDHLALVFNKVTPDRSTQKVEDFFKYPHCGSTTISTDPNVRSYCAADRLCGTENIDFIDMFTHPDGTPCPSC